MYILYTRTTTTCVHIIYTIEGEWTRHDGVQAGAGEGVSPKVRRLGCHYTPAGSLITVCMQRIVIIVSV